ncbi:hypothetical protein ACVWXL_007746 [Bradyrhizobium sp. GM22.5]
MMRDVYPGFLQLNGFISMNLDRHMDAHKQLFANLVKGDGDLVDKHRDFYDEYLAVMDLSAEYYLQTVDTVFVKHSLPKGEMTHRGTRVDPSKVTRVALMTVEGENDDISGIGQTEATHTLCSSIPDHRRVHYVQKGVGHYGVFNGSRFKSEIVPRIHDFNGLGGESELIAGSRGRIIAFFGFPAENRRPVGGSDRGEFPLDSRYLGSFVGVSPTSPLGGATCAERGRKKPVPTPVCRVSRTPDPCILGK